MANDAELDALVRLLRRAGGFRLAFAIVASDRQRDELLNQAGERSGLATVVVALSEGESAARQIIDGAGDAQAVFVVGLDERFDVREERSGVLANLNLNRDALRRNVPVPVVFWGPEFPVREIAVQAPDLWSGHADVFRFVVPAAQGRGALQEVREGWDWNLDAVAKAARHERLEQLTGECRGFCVSARFGSGGVLT